MDISANTPAVYVFGEPFDSTQCLDQEGSVWGGRVYSISVSELEFLLNVKDNQLGSS